MLDLEKKYKVCGLPSCYSHYCRTMASQAELTTVSGIQMARMHSSQTSPTSDSAASLPSPQSRTPLQARRRDSRESLAQKQSDQMLRSPRRTGPPVDLSISIPQAEVDKKRTSDIAEHPNGISSNHLEDRDDDDHGDDEDDDDSTPRERTVTFLAMDDDDEDDEDEEDRKSEQSSICQSPSWEGYGEKKKKKKAEAERKRKEKELAERQERLLREERKKTANRLAKASRPPTSPDPGRTGSSFSLLRPESSRSNSHLKSKQGKSSTESFVPPWVGIAIGAGGYVPGMPNVPGPKIQKSVSTPTSPKLNADAAFATAAAKSSLDAVQGLPYEKTKPANTMEEAVRKLTESQHSLKTLPGKDANSQSVRATFHKAHSLLGDSRGLGIMSRSKSPKPAAEAAPNGAANGVSYPPPASRTRALRHTAANSHMRSNSATAATAVKMEEASKFFKAQHMKSTQGSRLYSGMSLSDESLRDQAMEERGRKRSDSASYVDRARAQSAERSISRYMDEVAVSSLPQEGNDRPKTSHRRVQANGDASKEAAHRDIDATPVPARPVTRGKEGEGDYFNFVTKPYAPPSLELTSPTTGIFSTIKSKLQRGSSTGSSAPSTTSNTVKSAAAPAPSVASNADSTGRADHQSTASFHPAQPQADFSRLPKAARVLGEINPMTMQSGNTNNQGSRPSEGSSTSSYHDDSSNPPSPASTPDTSRPQSAKGLSAAIDEIRTQQSGVLLPTHEMLAAAQPQYHAITTNAKAESNRSSSSSSRTQQATESRSEARPSSKGRLLDTDGHRSKEPRNLDDLVPQRSKGRLLDDLERPHSRGRLLEVDGRHTGRDEQTDKDEARSGDVPSLGEDSWSRTAMPIDLETDQQAFVTNMDGLGSNSSFVTAPLETGPSKRPSAEAIPKERSRPSSRSSHRSDENRDSHRPSSRNSHRKEKTNSHTKQMSVVNEEPKLVESPILTDAPPLIQPAPVRPIDAGDVSFLPPLKHESLPPPKSKARTTTTNSTSSTSSTSSAPAAVEQHRTYAKAPFVPSEPSSGRSTPASGAAHHDPRRTAPHGPSPLSANSSPRLKSHHNAGPPLTASRPGFKSGTSSPQVHASRPAILPPRPEAKALSTSNTPLFRVPAQEPEAGNKPVAKMLVECCSCHFFHDMPSRVYECMASPDAVVTDRALGVSGAITTMVKCPWCQHNMSTQCCSGYAALVYLKEKLH
jgi:hypothetical protein